MYATTAEPCVHHNPVTQAWEGQHEVLEVLLTARADPNVRE